MENENWEYKITGQKGSLPRIIFIGIIAVFMAVLAIDQFKPAENKSLPLAFIFTFMAIVPLCLLVYIVNRTFFFKILIGKKGFYYQTNPFNGKYYSYLQVANSHIKIETSQSRQQGDNFQRHYLVFTLQDRTTKKFLYEPHIHEHEIEILKDRINTK